MPRHTNTENTPLRSLPQNTWLSLGSALLWFPLQGIIKKHTHTHTERNTERCAARAYKVTQGCLVAPAPVSLFTFTPDREDRGLRVGVNKSSGKWGEEEWVGWMACRLVGMGGSWGPTLFREGEGWALRCWLSKSLLSHSGGECHYQQVPLHTSNANTLSLCPSFSFFLCPPSRLPGWDFFFSRGHFLAPCSPHFPNNHSICATKISFNFFQI